MSASYSDEDLDAAVAAGVLTVEGVAGLRALAEKRRTAPIADDEQFRLLTGFNDIFVSIAILLVLVALAWLGWQVKDWVGPALVAVASWGLAEFFTRRRRMALPSLLLLLSWEAGVLIAVGAALTINTGAGPGPARLIGAAIAAGVAAFAHWRRFRVPITVAAGVCAVLGLAIALVRISLPLGDIYVLPLTFLSGICVFALALRWDGSDPQRKTRRADVAFWLHLAAAPLLVHPVFSWLGMSVGLFSVMAPPTGSGAAEIFRPAAAVGIYILLAWVALVIDRRALMVSALTYLLFAINSFFRVTGALSFSLALSALIAGAALLLLSAYWRAARGKLLTFAPRWLRARVPAA